MNVVDVSRWQFGITTVYHFIFVPLTIGLAPLVAVMQSAWVVTGKDHWYRLTKFFGKLFMINFALGVATGIVQEFQFGMNWSEYSRFVGDVFGAPLAMEGLVAFFMESTFLGLWIFGWTRLPKLVHLATIWLVAIGVNASAYFIIAANSFMQHPTGAIYNPVTKRAELHSIWQLLTNNTALAAFPHVVAGSFLTAGTFVAGVGGWWMVREVHGAMPISRGRSGGPWPASACGDHHRRRSAGLHRRYAGQADVQAAADEDGLGGIAVPHRDRPGLLDPHHRDAQQLRQRPARARGAVRAAVPGREQVQRRDAAGRAGPAGSATTRSTAPGDYRPNLFVTYWTFRAMITWAAGSAAIALIGLWMTRRGRVPGQNWYRWLSLLAIPTPFLGNSAGWVFTEMGRQPWVVAPNPTGDPRIRMTVQQAVSGNTAGTVLTSLIVFTLLYGVLAVVWFYLQRRYVVAGPEKAGDASGGQHGRRCRRKAFVRLLRSTAMSLPEFWFLLIAVLFTGYFVLEGFDFGVGMLMSILGRGSETRKRVVLNTIGPVWDGNEVWVITAGGALFAAFPEWYASLFSGFYLALLLILVALIVRIVGIEYRSKIDDPRWRTACDVAIGFGSWVPALAWGLAFANMVHGVKLNARQADRGQPAGTCSAPTHCSAR